MNELDAFIAVFVPLLAITNILPVLPIVLSILEELPHSQRAAAMRRALITVGVVGALVVLGGGAMLRWWGLTADDLRIAGGVVLLVFAIHDLLFSQMARKASAKQLDEEIEAELGAEHELSIVPLGVPILLGPAGMTALLVFGETSGRAPTLAAFVATFALNALLLVNAKLVRRVFGRAVVRATGKVMGLVLAALAVSMLRTGILNTIAAAS
ncbi:MAG: MarC family protein [Myxococcales bacterium]|nr:MarC family protein [Myxococcales bacterium]